VARRAGRAALDGLTRTLSVGIVAGVVSAAAGAGVLRLVGGTVTPGVAEALAQGMLSGVVVVAAFLGVAYALDRRDVRPLLATAVRRATRRRGSVDRSANGRS
jgi:putative peptidoglycan lipid II flippase